VDRRKEDQVAGRVVHLQVGATDADRLAAFYRRALGWNIRESRLTSLDADISGTYRFVDAAEAGISAGVTSAGPKGIVLTVAVDDIDETLERVERFGGRRVGDVAAEPLQLDDAGRASGTFAMHAFVDPEGNVVQLLQQ
jgi:predicted enzyme related to lactoylglutathione lyase